MTTTNFYFSWFFEICSVLLFLHYRYLPLCLGFVLLKMWQAKPMVGCKGNEILLLFFAWVLISCCWSGDPVYSFSKALSVVAITAVGALGYKNYTFPYNKKALIVTFFVLTALVMVECFTKAAIHQYMDHLLLNRPFNTVFNISFYNRFFTACSILFWPVWALIEQPLKRWGFLGAFLVALLWGPSESSLVSFICGLIGYVVIRHPFMVKMTFLAIQTTLFLAVFGVRLLAYVEPMVAGKIPFSLLHRFKIWEYFQQNIELRPIKGWGMDAAHILSKQQVFFNQFEVSALHPHNSVLQIWFELGGVGIIFFSLFFVKMYREMKTLPLNKTRLLCAQVVTAFVMSLSAFGMWQTWWLTALWIAAYLSKATIIQPKES